MASGLTFNVRRPLCGRRLSVEIVLVPLAREPGAPDVPPPACGAASDENHGATAADKPKRTAHDGSTAQVED
ncbi:MAG: hypothetical protein K2Z81_17725 [Cyanobacteria bacterium]|nr:hypothetical protein [Cyanobacteriota bacterium]